MIRLVAKILVGASAVLCSMLPVSGNDIVETAVEAGQFKTLAAALDSAGLLETLKGPGPFTVFAPTDEAFANLPEGTVASLLEPENRDRLVSILSFHVTSGAQTSSEIRQLETVRSVNGQRIDISVTEESVTIEDAHLVQKDIICDNGVIHVIDSVLMPTEANLAEVAVQAGTFETLVAAVKAAGLLDAVTGEVPLTVFAPTDDAFAKLPAGTVASLLKPENRDRLVDILKYHIVPGRVYSDAVANLKTAKTLNGSSLSFKTDHGIEVNGAKVITGDVDATNGVIHVVNQVLLPPMSADAACEKIETAVAKGSALFNNGHHKSCSELYMTTMRSIMQEKMRPLNDHDYQYMRATISKAEHEHHMANRAWILRRGLDRIYFALKGH